MIVTSPTKATNMCESKNMFKVNGGKLASTMQVDLIYDN